LVDDLLDVSRIQQGRLDLRPEPIDLAELAREVTARFAQAPELTERHRLRLEAPDALPGRWDANRLDQVLTNLLSNAIKYSPEGGEAVVSARRRGDEAEIVVSDQGIGIAPAEQAKLFQPFARGEAVRRRFAGTGLGLYIAARIIEHHGGGLSVESEPGVGSRFTARLPLEPSGEAADPGATPPMAAPTNGDGVADDAPAGVESQRP
jgi:signal transduction histidine kinase